MIAYQVGDVVLHQPPRGSQRLVRVTQRQDTLIGDGQFCGRVLCDCGAEPMLPVWCAGFDSEIVAVQAALPLGGAQ